MLAWIETSKVRDDDPYHCWAYHRRLKPRPAPDKELCPVVVEVKETCGPDKQATVSTLLTQLKLFQDLVVSPVDEPARDVSDVDGTRPKISVDDWLHLGTSITELEKVVEGDPHRPVGPELDYARIFLVYTAERYLFPEASRQINWPPLHILYIGRAIRNLLAGDFVKRASTTGQKPPDACLVIVDDSLAFLNEEFVRDGRTLFREIWFQDRERFVAGKPLYNGARINGDYIDRLRSDPGKTEAEKYMEPVETHEDHSVFYPIDPTSEAPQPLAHAISHGTHVASTALRTFEANSFNRSLELFGVTLPTDVTQDTSGASIGSYILAALRQAMLWGDLHYTGGAAADIPLIINFSYGFNAGPKDGTSPLNRVIARMIESRNLRDRETWMTVPMGNAYDERGVASMKLARGQQISLDWVIPDDDMTSSFLEVFARPVGTSTADFTIAIDPPGEQGRNRAPPPVFGSKSGTANIHLLQDGRDNQPVAGWSLWSSEVGSAWTHRGFVAIAPTKAPPSHTAADAGRYRLTFTNMSPGEIEIWAFVQRDDTPGTYPANGRQSWLDHAKAWAFGDGKDRQPPSGGYDQLDPEGPITHERTANVLASIDSDYVLAIGAGMGDCLPPDGSRPAPAGPSPYASLGPRLPHRPGPDAVHLADRSYEARGIYAAGTYSGTEVRLSGSSVAAPQAAGRLAAAHARKLPDR